jgi:hypothetical protein
VHVPIIEGNVFHVVCKALGISQLAHDCPYKSGAILIMTSEKPIPLRNYNTKLAGGSQILFFWIILSVPLHSTKTIMEKFADKAFALVAGSGQLSVQS